MLWLEIWVCIMEMDNGKTQQDFTIIKCIEVIEKVGVEVVVASG